MNDDFKIDKKTVKEVLEANRILREKMGGGSVATTITILDKRYDDIEYQIILKVRERSEDD